MNTNNTQNVELLFELKRDSYIKGFLYKKGVRLKLLPQEAKSFIASGVLIEVEGVMNGFSNQQNVKHKRYKKERPSSERGVAK